MDQRTARQVDLLATINAGWATNYANLSEVPTNILLLQFNSLQEKLESYQRSPNRDTLTQQRQALEAQQSGLIERFADLDIQCLVIDSQLNPDGWPNNTNYQGAVGNLRVVLTHVIHLLLERYAPSDPESGEVLEDWNQPVFDFLWTLINYLDDELDFGVARRDQLIEQEAARLTSEAMIAGKEVISNHDILAAVETQLRSDFEFNLKETKRQLGFKVD